MDYIQSMDFSRPEYWSGRPFPSPRDLPDPGIKPRSPTMQADSLPAEPQGKPHYNTSPKEQRLCISCSLLYAQGLGQSLPYRKYSIDACQMNERLPSAPTEKRLRAAGVLMPWHF